MDCFTLCNIFCYVNSSSITTDGEIYSLTNKTACGC